MEPLELLAFIFIIGVPSMAFATRFVIRPLIREIVEAIRGIGDREEGSDVELRLGRLEKLVLEQSEQIGQLAEAEGFRRQLESSEATAAVPPAGDASDARGPE